MESVPWIKDFDRAHDSFMTVVPDIALMSGMTRIRVPLPAEQHSSGAIDAVIQGYWHAAEQVEGGISVIATRGADVRIGCTGC